MAAKTTVKDAIDAVLALGAASASPLTPLQAAGYALGFISGRSAVEPPTKSKCVVPPGVLLDWDITSPVSCPVHALHRAGACSTSCVWPTLTISFLASAPPHAQAEVKQLAAEMISTSRTALDAVVATGATHPSWATVMQPLVDNDTVTTNKAAVLEFLQHVSADKEVR